MFKRMIAVAVAMVMCLSLLPAVVFANGPAGLQLVTDVCARHGVTVGGTVETGLYFEKDGRVATVSNYDDVNFTALFESNGASQWIDPYHVVSDSGVSSVYVDEDNFIWALQVIGFEFTYNNPNMSPLRTLCESIGMTVGWDDIMRSTTITVGSGSEAVTAYITDLGNDEAILTFNGTTKTIEYLIAYGRAYVNEREFLTALFEVGFPFNYAIAGGTPLREVCERAEVEINRTPSGTELIADYGDGNYDSATIVNNALGSAVISSGGQNITIQYGMIDGRAYVIEFEFLSALYDFGFAFRYLIQGGTQLRPLCESNGITIGWDAQTRGTTFEKGDSFAVLLPASLGEAVISSGERNITVQYSIVDGRAHVVEREFIAALTQFGFTFDSGNNNNGNNNNGGNGGGSTTTPSPSPTPTPTPATPAPSPTPQPEETAPVHETVVSVVEVNQTEVLELLETRNDLVIETAGAEITIPNDVLAEISATLGIENLSVDISLTTGSFGEADDTTGNLVTVGINISADDTDITALTAPVTVSVLLEDFDLSGVNTHRIVAIDENGNIVGGSLDPVTGLFTFETAVTGNFTITYEEDLRRIVVGLDSNVISDLAGNAPTQVMDVPPMVVDGRTLLPIRFLTDALGGEIGWDDATKSVTITVDGRVLTFAIGEAAPGMDTPAILVDGRTMIPARFISEFFGALVTYDEEARAFEIIC